MVYRYVDKKVWENWKEGMQLIFSKRAFREAWKTIVEANVNYYDKKFRDFVNENLLNQKHDCKNK
jgi:hypothetical protein